MDLLFLQSIDTLSDGSMMQTTSIFELALKGGPVMIPIALCSLIGLYIFIERYLTLQKASKIDENFMSNIRDFVMSDNIAAAKALCKQTNSPIARMIEKGLDRIGKPLRDIEASIENVGKMELFKLERGIGILATVAGLAPMLGFFGTVTGMVSAFYQMANAGNNITIGVMSGGIYEALVTTVAGLGVGIPALVCYNWLIGLIDKIVNKMETNSIEFIDLLQEPV